MVIRPPGSGSSYKAELYALLLGCDIARPLDKICTDSHASIMAIAGKSERIIMGNVVERIRRLIEGKELTLIHVRGHMGIRGNEKADALAKEMNEKLPEVEAPEIRQPYEIQYGGEIRWPPHKQWIREICPKHHPSGVHSISWRKIHDSTWAKWLLGMASGIGV